MLLVCHSAGHRVGVALIANYSFNIKPMNLGELFISVPCHFDSYHILHFNGCHEPHVHLCSIFFHGTCRQSWDSRHTGPSRACVVVSLIAYFCAQWGRRPEADCLLPTEKFHNSSTMHFLEYFLVVIKHEWRDLLERKKMRNIFKSPCRWIVSDTLHALTLEWWEYSQSFHSWSVILDQVFGLIYFVFRWKDVASCGVWRLRTITALQEI